MGIYEEMFDDETNKRMLCSVYEKKGIEQGIEQGIQQGIEQGIEQGTEQGIQQGIEQESARIAERLILSGMPPDKVADIIGIPLEDAVRIASKENRTIE